MKGAWFYLAVFIVAAGIPSWGAYLASRKYEDEGVFIWSTVACVLFAAAALGFSYVRDRKLRNKD